MQQKAMRARKPLLPAVKEDLVMVGFAALFFLFWQFAAIAKDAMPESKRRSVMRLVFGGCVNLGIGVLIIVFARFYHEDVIFLGLIGTAVIHVILGGFVAKRM